MSPDLIGDLNASSAGIPTMVQWYTMGTLCAMLGVTGRWPKMDRCSWRCCGSLDAAHLGKIPADLQQCTPCPSQCHVHLSQRLRAFTSVCHPQKIQCMYLLPARQGITRIRLRSAPLGGGSAAIQTRRLKWICHAGDVIRPVAGREFCREITRRKQHLAILCCIQPAGRL